MRRCPNIMKAKKKPIDDKAAADYGVDAAPRPEVVKTVEPAGPQGRRQGRRQVSRTGKQNSKRKPE